MDFYNKLARKPKLFLSVTGVPLHTFQRLLPRIEDAFIQHQAERKLKTVRTAAARQRAAGAGRAFNNDLANRSLMLLVYYRLYLTQDFMTFLFKAADKSVICRNIQQMRPLIESILPTPERARQRIFSLVKAEHERRQKRIGSIDEFREAYPELTFIIDGVEQPKRKPKDQQKRKADYSGKKKRHTRKQLVTATPNGIIVDQSPSVGGRKHDFQAFKEDHEQRGIFQEFAELRATVYGDSGFQGMADLGLPLEVRLLERGRRNHPLSHEQKQINQLRARTRVKIEHTLSRRKKYRIAAEEYRNRDEEYDQAMNIVGGLVNLRAYERVFQRTGIRL
jgi:DDE superfamily endonuclease